jgi:TolA-binding protein
MKKELKKQIKEDELVSGFEHLAAWGKGHAREVKVGAGVLLGLAVVVGSLSYLQANRQAAARAAFASALQGLDTPVAGENPPGAPAPQGPVFATREEKFRKATAAFDGVERAYPSLREGQWAGYYAAIARMQMGDRAEAEKQLAAMVKVGGGGIEPSLARLALANLQRLSGALDKAAESYKGIADDPSFGLPRDYVLMTLALTLEEAHRLDEARAAYQRVADEFPEGVYAADARRRADYLKPVVKG